MILIGISSTLKFKILRKFEFLPKRPGDKLRKKKSLTNTLTAHKLIFKGKTCAKMLYNWVVTCDPSRSL